MISRVAESCFWLHRHVERVDSMARLLEVNRAFVLDVPVPALEAWRPLVVVAGEEARFREIHGPEAFGSGEIVEEYLCWERRNPVSVVSAAYWARENARTVRETLSLEMWKCLNSFWLWLTGGPGRKLYARDRADFYRHLKETAQLFRGVCHDTMLHEDPFDFMRLGMLLERAGQTARLLDVKHHALGPTRPAASENAMEFAHWQATLRSCSAIEPFLKKGRAVSGRDAAEFLLFEATFPRSVHHCLDRAWNFLRRICSTPTPEAAPESAALLKDLLDHVRGTTITEVMASGIHEELTHLVEAVAATCEAIHRDFFDPQMPGQDWEPIPDGGARAAAESRQEQT